MSGISDYFFGLFKSKSKSKAVHLKENTEDIRQQEEQSGKKPGRKRYVNEYTPLRKFYVWGWDKQGNKAFLVLYGLHQYQYEKESGRYALEAQVFYTGYAVFSGKGGHFPSFAAKQEQWERAKDYKRLKEKDYICLPYDNELTYQDYLPMIMKMKNIFENFIIAASPKDVLELDQQHSSYYPMIFHILNEQNIYMRKKYLNELLDRNPALPLYQYLMKIGSSELICGLFLELGRRGNDILLHQCRVLLAADITWENESCRKGVRRCLALYQRCFDQEIQRSRIKEIRASLSNMDLHLIYFRNQKVPQEKVIDGAAYRKYALSGALSDYGYVYLSQERRMVRQRRPQRYEVGKYCDGVEFDVMEMKNTIQESEMYGLSDILGKIAYYLDAPRLTYYLRGNEKGKVLLYYQRYVRRMLDAKAEHDPQQFFAAMKVLLTSYQPQDYVCKFKGNFQFNYFIKHFLYHRFNETAPPTSYHYEEWQRRHEWMANDQLMKAEGRYEYKPELWEAHIGDVIEIAAGARIATVQKAMYYILKDYLKKESLSLSQLITLSGVSYQPMIDLMLKILKDRLGQHTGFDESTMLSLMDCDNILLHHLAIEYFDKTGGRFREADIVSLLLSAHAERWQELMIKNIGGFTHREFIRFLDQFLQRYANQNKLPSEHDDTIAHILNFSLQKIHAADNKQLIELLTVVVNNLYQMVDTKDYILEYCEKLIFTVPFDIVREFAINSEELPMPAVMAERVFIITAVFRSIRQCRIPPDLLISEVQKKGSPPLVKAVSTLIVENSGQLENRFSTLLLLFESSMVSLNEKAKEVYASLPLDQQKQFHSMLIDSPDEKVYSFVLQKIDEIYLKPGAKLPQELVKQMLEHTSAAVRAYISDKLDQTIAKLGDGDQELFMYYAKTLLLLPNRLSAGKNHIYQLLPRFVKKYSSKRQEVEQLLLDIGGSHIILDAERALVALAQINKEVV